MHILCGSGLPMGTGKHMPSLPTWLQEVHRAVQAMLQQTPSTQWADVQSELSTQPAPSAFLILAPQLSFAQIAGAWQSVPPTRQVVRQAGAPPAPVVSQMYGAQSTFAGMTQAPWPSQAPGCM